MKSNYAQQKMRENISLDKYNDINNTYKKYLQVKNLQKISNVLDKRNLCCAA